MSAEPRHTRVSDRNDGERKAREEREASALVEREKLTSFWSKQASAGFGQTLKHLVADLEIGADRAGEVEAVFAKREKELASLLSTMTSGGAADDKAVFGRICALIRNKGLREDLAGVLSGEQLEAFDAREAKRERETVEARAYSDMAEINTVVPMTDSQKREVLGALMKAAPEKVEAEANTRAFMSLTYGPLATEMESSAFRGVTNMVNAGLSNEDPSANIEIHGAEYRQRVESQKAERIGNELSILRGILDEDQIARYRQHLESQPAW